MICVDWTAGALDPNYVRAAVNTRLVGKQVRELPNCKYDISGKMCNCAHSSLMRKEVLREDESKK